MFKGNFIDNLPKIYGTYTGGFIVFILLMAIAEQAGMTAKTIGILFVAFTVCIYAFIGYMSRTVQVDAYYVAEDRCQQSLTEWLLRLTGCQAHHLLLWLVVFILVVTHIWLS